MLPKPLLTGATGQTPLSTLPTTELPAPHQDNLTQQKVPGQRQAPGAGVPHHPLCNHTNTPHHHHCNDSSGRNINQLSSTIATQLIQMPVTPYKKRGHSPPTHTLQPLHATLQPAAQISHLPGHDSQKSSTPPSLPNHPANASSPSPPVHQRETCANQVTAPCRPTAPGQTKAPTPHPPDRQPQPGVQAGARATEGSIRGSPPQHSTPSTGHPANLTTKPGPHQARRPASPSTKAKPHPDQHCTLPGQDPLARARPPLQPTDQAPKSGIEIQRNLNLK
ncbi:hypothetical protein CRENBAI_004858 [Crenichthys baileyi]|uniref:Uncharacterized protein n=1 Tax=Crenichthys baileyi TaxID=28760 RepID=A0AAV9RN73_9TELE